MTNIEELYEMFLSKITDYKFLTLIDEEIEDEMFKYFKSARAKFYRCRNSLEVVDKKIQSDLTYYEIEVLVALMLVEYITPKLISGENMSQSLSDKDFKIYSQANQLREIRLLLNSMEAKAERMMTTYTYFGIEKEKM